ncbi:MAG: Polysaccharide biosynthesis protein [bacterium ADurb.Bin478]|nr:MAG: Polysaccharide biosynthesis protein [bacterium ADurb.Bin478]
MDVHLKKFLRHSSNYAVGELLAFSASFVSFPILTRALTQNDYGVMSVFSVTLWIFLAFSRAGLAESTVRFYREYNQPEDSAGQSVYYSTFFFGTVAFALVTALLVVLFGKQIIAWLFHQDLPGFHYLLAGLIVTGTLYARLLNFYRASQRTISYNIAMVASRFTILAVSLSAVLLVAGTLKVYYTAILAAETVTMVVLVGIFLAQNPVSIASFSGSFFKTCLRFGFPLIGFELGYLLLKSVDRYIIQFMLGSEAVAVFSVASNMGHYTKDLILFPLMYALTPIYIEVWHEKGKEATSRFVSTVANISLLVLIPIFLLMTLLGRELIVVLASDKYASAGDLLGVIVAGTLLWALLPIYASGLYIAKKTQIISFTVLVCVLLDVGLNLVFIRWWGIRGSCYAALLTCFLLAAYLSYRSRLYLKVTIHGKTIVVGLIASLVLWGVAALLPDASHFLGVVLKMAILGLTFTGAVLLLHGEVRRMVVAAVAQGRRLLRSSSP